MKSEGVSLTRDSPPVTSSCNIVNKPITIIKHNINNNSNQQQQKVINNNNTNNKRHICPKCGLLINSVESLKVHMQYQHEDMSRWGVPSSVPPTGQSIVPITPVPSTTSSSSSVQSSIPGGTTNSDGGGGNNNNNNNSTGNITTITNQSSRSSPTDTENNNNNQPSSKHHQLQQYTTGKTDTTSPLHSSNNTNSTVSAAADSSDNQPSTPQPSSIVSGTGSSGGGSSGGGSCNEQQQQQSTPHSYTGTTNSPYHHTAQGNNILSQEMHPYPAYMHGYDQFYHPPPGMDYAQTTLYPGNQASAPHQEYKLVPSSRYHPYLNNSSHMQQQQQQQMPLHTNSGNTNGNNTTSSTISNSSLSPRVVSSSSPTQNSIIGQTGQDSTTMSQISQGQPTPSPSPKQCDKCGMVCQTDAQLSEHYTTAHGVPPQSSDAIINRSGGGDDNDIQSQYSYQPYIKEEPSSDILDLDSQKMVYPPTHDAINQEPLPPMHSMHPMHRPLMWGAEMHTGYMPHSQTDLKQPYYSPIKQPYPTIKQEYAAMKQPDYPTGTGFGGQMIKSEFNAHHQTIAPQTRADIKSFGTDITSGNNPVSSSPSEFPSTTTPQDNGPQFRGFEPPTSSLPNNPPSTKSATWKSNEARRPKTYNCTACNKWFTSSGHLKRHYNTTLHKNAVKSSGQPDPATMPISAHHHPSRDPNSKHHRNSQSQQPPPAPPEPPRSPEYTPQYTPPPGGFTQPQSFQQYNTSIHSASNGHPNGQAGPSVHASQPRGLLIISTMEATSNLEQEDQVQHNQQQREEQYHQQILEEHLNPNLEHQQQAHIISMSPHHQHHQDTISTTPTTTTIRSTMDQQQYIISPLAINTTTNIIPSFQHLQHPAEHLQSYHTIIGNDSHITNNETDHLLQFDSFDMPVPHQQIQLATIHHLQTTTDGQQVSTITALNPSIVELHRLSGGVATYRENTAMPFSPVVPESYLRSAPSNCERSPQEADVAPPQSSAPPTSFPYSPTISSTVTTTAATTTTQKKPAPKRKKTISTSSSSAPSSNSSSVSTSPSGKIECIECGKEFAKSCYLTQHNKTFHSGEQPFRCQKCGKRFQCQETYDTHLAKHKAQDKPYKCDKCPKQFHHKTDLRRHRDGHTGYKAHVCDTCSKGFCRKDHLRKHSDTHKPKPTKKKITA